MAKKPLEQSNSKKKQPNEYARWSGIAFQMIGIVVAGVWAGIWLDNRFELRFPVFKLILSFLSVVLAMYSVIREFLKNK
jgi:ATP synthase protein I